MAGRVDRGRAGWGMGWWAGSSLGGWGGGPGAGHCGRVGPGLGWDICKFVSLKCEIMGNNEPLCNNDVIMFKNYVIMDTYLLHNT